MYTNLIYELTSVKYFGITEINDFFIIVLRHFILFYLFIDMFIHVYYVFPSDDSLFLTLQLLLISYHFSLSQLHLLSF